MAKTSTKKSKKNKDDVYQGRIIDFMGQRKIALIFSAVLLIASVISLAVNGLKFGLDFTGGLQIEAQFSEPVDLVKIRSGLTDSGFKDAVVVNFGSERDLKITTQQDRLELIKVQLLALNDNFADDAIVVSSVSPQSDDRLPSGGLLINVNSTNDDVIGILDDALKAFRLTDYSVSSHSDGVSTEIISSDGVQVLTERLLIKTLSDSAESDVSIKRTEFVGPQIGAELRDQGGIGLLFALVVVMIYVALRFQYKFSLGAVAALIHDVLIVLGFFSVFNLDFDLTVLAAVLAVIGYSLNDTIVVSDRIRENFRKMRKGSPEDVINQSLSQTLGRTLVTSLTTLLVLLALFFVGGELIHSFSVALIIGILIGTYSSIYVAANVLLMMHISKEDLMVPEKEGAELDDLPQL